MGDALETRTQRLRDHFRRPYRAVHNQPNRHGQLHRRSDSLQAWTTSNYTFTPAANNAFMRDVGARHDPTLTDLALNEAVSFRSSR
jgi:hypothetical protein